MYIDLYDTSVVGCSNKTDRDSNSEYKKKCKPRKCLIYTFYWRRERLMNLMGITLCSNILYRFDADTVARLLHDFDKRRQGFVEVCQTIFATATAKLIIFAEIEPLRNVKISWNNTTLLSWKSQGSIPRKI